MDGFTVYATNSIIGLGSAAGIVAVADLQGEICIDGVALVWSADGAQKLYDKCGFRIYPAAGAHVTVPDAGLLTDVGRDWVDSRLRIYVDEWHRAVPGRPLPPPFTLSAAAPALLVRLWLRGVCRDAILDVGRTTRSKALRDAVAALKQLPDIRPDVPPVS